MSTDDATKLPRMATHLEAFLLPNGGGIVCGDAHRAKADGGDIRVADLTGGERHLS